MNFKNIQGQSDFVGEKFKKTRKNRALDSQKF
jgi:hypothetical protein